MDRKRREEIVSEILKAAEEEQRIKNKKVFYIKLWTGS
jgi:predicted transcriptional regulator